MIDIWFGVWYNLIKLEYCVLEPCMSYELAELLSTEQHLRMERVREFIEEQHKAATGATGGSVALPQSNVGEVRKWPPAART
mgnify:CR=1 FL=1